jgi:hypothetical protein
MRTVQVIREYTPHAWDFKNGFAKVIVGKDDDAKTGYIDKSG